MLTLVFPAKGMNKVKPKTRKIFSYKRICLTICGAPVGHTVSRR